MKKKKVYHLRSNVKEIIKTTCIITFIYLLIIGYLLLLNDRFEKIEKGQIVQISEEYMK